MLNSPNFPQHNAINNKQKMSSSLSDLRNFRMKKTNGKVANGRKRIRVVSDSSDDDNGSVAKQPKNVENGDAGIKQKEESLQNLRQITSGKIDFMILQDVLAQCDWDTQKAYDQLEKDPKYGPKLTNSPIKPPSPVTSRKRAVSPSPQKAQKKVSYFNREFNKYLDIVNCFSHIQKKIISFVC